MAKKKLKILAAALLLAGAAAGLISWRFNLWEVIEPLIGFLTLSVAALGVLKNKALEGALKAQASMSKKEFELTFGLREGYTCEGETFSFMEASELIQSWMASRIEAKLPILTGKLDEVKLIYPVRVGTPELKIVAEPSVTFSGILSPVYDKDRTDVEVIATITSLAEYIKNTLKQKRVYCSFLGKSWVI